MMANRTSGFTILAVARRVLDQPDLGLEDNLLHAGMTSVQAARFVVELDRQAGVQAELADIFGYPTVAELGRLYAPHDESVRHHADGVLVRLAEGAGHDTLYCVHGGNGQVGFMRPLFTEFAAKTGITVVGVQAPGLKGDEPPLRTIPELAARYLAEISATGQPTPQLLAGYCAGGEIAIEMAHQLEERGQAPRFTAIFDPFAADPAFVELSDAQLLRFRIEELVSHCVAAGHAPAGVDPMMVGSYGPLAITLARLGRLSRDGDVDELHGQLAVWLATLRALHTYTRPQSLPRLDVFRAVRPGSSMHGGTVHLREHTFTGEHDYLFQSPELAPLLGDALSLRTQTMVGFTPLLDRFDAFVLDQWGVLHEGNKLHEGVATFLAELRRRDKEVLILTNSSKTSARNVERLGTTFGLDSTLYSALVSSADLIRDHLAGAQGTALRRVFVVADEDDEQLIDGLDVQIADKVADADAIVVLSLHPATSASVHRAWIHEGVERGLPLLCPSNDVHTVRSDGVFRGMASVIGEYQDRGGRVVNFGKPEPHVYTMCQHMLATTDRQRVLAVGDQIASDIEGARRHGWATALVLTGAGLRSLASTRTRPDFIIESLAL